MDKKKHIFWEIILLIGSIFSFRSAWHLMDKIPFLNRADVLFLFLLLGVILMSMGFFKVVHAEKKEH